MISRLISTLKGVLIEVVGHIVKIRVPYFGVLIVRILLLLRVLYIRVMILVSL